jgi:hypothetical protein
MKRKFQIRLEYIAGRKFSLKTGLSNAAFYKSFLKWRIKKPVKLFRHIQKILHKIFEKIVTLKFYSAFSCIHFDLLNVYFIC